MNMIRVLSNYTNAKNTGHFWYIRTINQSINNFILK